MRHARITPPPPRIRLPSAGGDAPVQGPASCTSPSLASHLMLLLPRSWTTAVAAEANGRARRRHRACTRLTSPSRSAPPLTGRTRRACRSKSSKEIASPRLPSLRLVDLHIKNKLRHLPPPCLTPLPATRHSERPIPPPLTSLQPCRTASPCAGVAGPWGRLC